MIAKHEVDAFWRDGFIVAENAVDRRQLARLRGVLAEWVDDSRNHDAPFGEPTTDGRPRFDLAPEHSAAQPALRRVNNPSEIDDAYMEAMRDSAMTEMVTALIGPDVKHHHCKINLKLPGSNTEVRYHQDFAYTPHTNDDVVTALLMLDDMTPENGCLMAVPGSHRGPVYSLFDGERFTGFVAPAVERSLTGARGAGSRQRRQRLPDAHPARARLRAQPFVRAARSLHLCLQRCGRLPHRPQPHAEPQRGHDGARPAYAPCPPRRGDHRAARAADTRIVLRGAGGGRRLRVLIAAAGPPHGRLASRSISTRASRASPVTPTHVRAGRRSGSK